MDTPTFFNVLSSVVSVAGFILFPAIIGIMCTATSISSSKAALIAAGVSGKSRKIMSVSSANPFAYALLAAIVIFSFKFMSYFMK